MENGKIYIVDSIRKGKFTGQLVSFDETWATFKILKGKDLAYWLADKIHAFGDYAKEAAQVLQSQANEIEQLHSEVEALKLSDKCWRFVSHEGFIRTSGYDTCGDWRGISVGIQKSQLISTNNAILGRGQTLKDAVLNAVKKWEET